MEWIKVEDRLPEKGEKVFYYFEHVGVWKGEYRGMTSFGPQFGSKEGGFLTGDVTHWQPSIGQDDPESPK